MLTTTEATYYFDRMLENVEWRNDEAVIFGRHIVTKRKVAWYGDESYSYAYSGKVRDALGWTAELLELKVIVERLCGRTFNSCLLNLYHNGEEGMAWHSDDEKTLAPDGAIASLSLGAERKFSFRHRKTRETIAVQLEPGSLLVMHGTTQTYWMHALPKSKRVTMPRVNLTFRTMVR
jgi:alkylated DNA repair dioxygenase AlkB